jgi:hypothetical protein
VPKYKRVIFSGHYFDRKLKKRPYLTKTLVKSVLDDPTNEVPAKQKGRRKFWKKIDNEKYTVVVRETKNGEIAFVITAYRQ